MNSSSPRYFLAVMYISLLLFPAITNFFLFWRIISYMIYLPNLIYLPRIIEFGVNRKYSKSFSIYATGILFKLTSISNNTSSNSDHANNDLPRDLYRLCFVSPIKRSYCHRHHGALETLNFQIIFSLLKKS